MGGCTRRSPGPLTMCCSDEVLWTTHQGLHLLDKKGSYAITVCFPFHTIVPPRLITNSRTWDKTPHWACGSFTSCLADSRFWGWVDTPLPLASLTPEKKNPGLRSEPPVVLHTHMTVLPLSTPTPTFSLLTTQWWAWSQMTMCEGSRGLAGNQPSPERQQE